MTIPDVVAQIMSSGQMTSELERALESLICKDYYTADAERHSLALLLDAINEGQITVEA